MPLNPLYDRQQPLTSRHSGYGREILDDIYCLTVQIVNVYFIGHPSRPMDWVLIDAGMPGSEGDIVAAAQARFGPNACPRAIVLTHGHFDHVGAVVELAQRWQVPVYAHIEEMPYVTGQMMYPAPDPWAGGAISQLSRWFPREPVDLGDYVRPLPSDGDIPGLGAWEWVHTPGHTPGHVSLFRKEDGALIAGDAFVTVQQESLYKVYIQEREISGPPRYFTQDWSAAKASIECLAARAPRVAMTGHGVPIEGDELTNGLRDLILRFETTAMPG